MSHKVLTYIVLGLMSHCHKSTTYMHTEHTYVPTYIQGCKYYTYLRIVQANSVFNLVIYFHLLN